MSLAVRYSTKNYFELFDLPVRFAVDRRLLAERYRLLARGRDPCSADESVIRADDARLSILEDAYRTLMDPLARAEYLLGFYSAGGVDDAPGCVASEMSGGAALMDQIELRETLVSSTNRSDPAAARDKMMTHVAERSAALEKELQHLFADPSPGNLSAARGIVRQLQFLGRCRRDAEDLQVGSA